MATDVEKEKAARRRRDKVQLSCNLCRKRKQAAPVPFFSKMFLKRVHINTMPLPSQTAMQSRTALLELLLARPRLDMHIPREQ